MKVRSKDTGQILELKFSAEGEYFSKQDIETFKGKPLTLARLNDAFEDYEEPKRYWIINGDGLVCPSNYGECPHSDLLKEKIGNHFETEEEAEKASEKLKAWKRLKDKGFRFTKYKSKIGWEKDWFEIEANCECDVIEEIEEDLDLLFGGEE